MISPKITFVIMSDYCNEAGCSKVHCLDCDSSVSTPNTIKEEHHDRVSRATYHLEASKRRVKKARIHAQRDRLQFEFVTAKEQLDKCVLLIAQGEEIMDDAPLSIRLTRTDNLKKLHDQRQLLLMNVVETEARILDFVEDEIDV